MPDEKSPRTSYPYQIAVTVDNNGNFTYSPSTLHVQPGDTVEWQCPTPFTIMFKDDGTPIGNMTLYGQASGPGYATSPATVCAGASGHFHYAVAVWSPANNKVQLDSGCPDLICN
jgi:plastocyanin